MSEETSYGKILKASSIMGGAAGINLLVGMVRTKFTAVLIGVGGIGLLANYLSIQTMIGSVAGLGIQLSAVRSIALAVAKEDTQAIARIVVTLRRVCWVTGLLGVIVMVVLSPFLSRWTFGNAEYVLQISLLGLVILFANISGGQMALIQGMQKIGDLARVNVASSIFGALGAIGFYVWLGLEGVIPALLFASFTQLTVSWFFVRQISVPNVFMTWPESFHEAGGMIRLGIAFMWTGLAGSAAIYIINAMLMKQIGIEAVGLYTAAFALSGITVKFVFQAMSYDFYPRLAALADDKGAMNRIVNEQTEIGLLLAVPGLLATLSLAPWIIQVFYTSEFLPAANLLQWFILGCLISVIQWPMGFLQVALGMGASYAVTQIFFTIVHLGLIWIGLVNFGIEGASIAYFLYYLFALFVMMYIAHRLTGFVLTSAIHKLLFVFIPVAATSFFSSRLLPLMPATIVGIIVTVIASVVCLRGLVRRVGSNHRLVLMAFRVPGMRRICGEK